MKARNVLLGVCIFLAGVLIGVMVTSPAMRRIRALEEHRIIVDTKIEMLLEIGKDYPALKAAVLKFQKELQERRDDD